jgi:hypothetical protein
MRNPATLVADPTVQEKNFEINPCLLVLDKIRVDRAVSYDREELDTRMNDDGSEDKEWKTRRHYKNRAETERANQLYNQLRYKLRAVCTATEIGFLCPESKEADLRRVIDECKQMVEEANTGFTHCNVRLRIVCTRIEPSNTDGVEMLKETIRDMTNEVRNALGDFDAKKAKQMLKTTQGFADMIADPAQRQELMKVRAEAKMLADQMQKVILEFDGNVANAVASQEGTAILARTKTPWDIF